MRNLIAALVLFTATSGFASSFEAPLLDKKAVEKLDPIITGKSVTKEQYARWSAARKLAKECPACSIAQAYPKD